MAWELKSDRPIYIQLVEEIKLRIITGVYSPGEKIPAVRELASEAEVNPNTMQRALAELEESGLVITHRTTGRMVTNETDVILNEKNNTAKEVIIEFLKKMDTLGFNKKETLEFIKREIKEDE